jgi:hypothetical protein
LRIPRGDGNLRFRRLTATLQKPWWILVESKPWWILQ